MGSTRFAPLEELTQQCPSPPLRSTPRCSTAPRPAPSRTPRSTCTSSQTLNAALRGFAEAESDGIVQVSTGGAEFASGQLVKDMVTGAVALAEFAHVVAAKYDVQHRAAHRPLPQGQARRLHAAAASTSAPSGWPAASSRSSSRTCGTARPSPLGENLDIADELLDKCAAAQHHPGGRDRRRRRRGGRRRGQARRQALHHARGRPGHRRGARPRRARPLHGRRDLRQRARRLQAGQRHAHARRSSRTSRTRSARSTARTSRSTWSSTAAPARCSRRSARPSTTASSR